MLYLDEINSSETKELLTAFERMSKNEELSVNLYRPEGYLWYIKDVLQDRLPSEIKNEKNPKRLEYLCSVAERLHRIDLCNIIRNKISEMKKPPSTT